MNTPTITAVDVYTASAVTPFAERMVTVTLSNGEKVTIAGAYNGFEQYGSYRNMYAITLPIAQRYAKWLNGGACPNI